MSLQHISTLMNTHLQALPRAPGTALMPVDIDQTQQANFQWLLALTHARTGMAELSTPTRAGELPPANDDVNSLPKAPQQPLAAPQSKLFTITQTAQALAQGDIANMRLLQVMHPHPLSLRNDEYYIDDDVLDNGLFLREQISAPEINTAPELLHELYISPATT